MRLHVRLSLLSFLVYAALGAWVPLIALYLHDLGFTPMEVASVCATSALGAILGPLVWGQIADRWLASERCISVCAACGALTLLLASASSDFLPIFLFTLIHWFFFVPVCSLCASLTFRHLTEPEGSFGPIRMWGTVGWVSASCLLGLWLRFGSLVEGLLEVVRPDYPYPELGDCLRWAAILALALAVYAYTLPTTPPMVQASTKAWWRAMADAPLYAASLLKRRELGCLAVCLFGAYVTLPFSQQMTPLLLTRLGITEDWLPATLAIAQTLEVTTLALLPRLLHHLGERRTLLTGLTAWCLALLVLALGEPAWLVIASFALHGIFICCFFVAGQLTVNRRAAGHFRASAQGLLQWIAGLGMLIGHLATGAFRQATGDHFGFGFAAAALLTAILTIILMVGFAPVSE